jgi:hypothetical protein
MPGGSISGTVTNAGGSVLTNICIYARPAAAGIALPMPTLTDNAGHYTLSRLTNGAYVVQFADCASGAYLPQYFNGQGTPGAASLVTISGSASVTGVDAHLVAAGSIGGRVTDAASASALDGICVDVFPRGGSIPTASGLTGPDGSYQVRQLPAGPYAVEFTDCSGGGHTAQWANNKATRSSADAITVSSGGTTGGINAALTH